MKPFQLFGTEHLSAIFGSILAIFFLIMYAKNEQNKANRNRDIWIFTIVFILIESALVGSKIATKAWSIEQNLPLHLCDFSAFTIIYALFSRSQRAFELGYFWGFVGGLMGILLANLQQIDWYFAPFFVWHLFLIVGPIYQIFIDGFRLTYRSIYETLGITIVLAAFMMVFNSFLGSNYMFVSQKISSFDALGLPEFPYFLPYLAAIALIMFHLAWLFSKLLKPKS
jgi:hypothetical integral membrane protein (TIGR02206 family)